MGNPKIYIVWIIHLIIFNVCNVFSLDLNYRHYTIQDGLSSNCIYAAFQDKRGLIWFASDNGLARFNGYEFERFSFEDGLSDTEIFDFVEDNNGRIWFLTFNGKACYYENGKFFNSQNDTTIKGLDFNSMILSGTVDSVNNIWFSSKKNGVSYYSSNGLVKRFFAKNELGGIPKVFPKEQGYLEVFGVEGIFEFCVSDNTIFLKNKFKDSIILPKPKRLGTDKIIFKTQKNVFLSYKDTIELIYTAKSQVNNICKEERVVWICTATGVVRYNMEEEKFYEPLFVGKNIASVLKDNEGGYWVTTLDEGVYYCSQNLFNSDYKIDKYNLGKIHSLSKDSRGNLLLGMSNMSVIFFDRKWRGYFNILEDSLKRNSKPVYDVIESSEAIYICTDDYLIEKKQSNHKYFGCDCKGFLEFPKGQFWTASTAGLNGLRQKDFLLAQKKRKKGFYSFDSDTINLKRKIFYGRVNKLFLSKDNQVFFSTNQGFYKIDKQKPKRVYDWFLDEKNIVVDFVQVDERTHLFATKSQGIIVKSGDTIFRISTNDGLISNSCRALTLLDEKIWVATNEGVSRIAKFLEDEDEVMIDNFLVSEVLGANSVSDLLVLDDTVWVATDQGLRSFYKGLKINKKSISKVYFSNVMVNGISCMDSLQFENSLVFQPNENNIEIKFYALSYLSNGNIVYRYRLFSEDDWAYTKNTGLTLPNLSPGYYELIISAKGINGVWGESGRLSFEIKTALWKMPWIQFAGLVILILVVLIVVKFQVIKVKRRNREKYQIIQSELKALRSQMNPHFFFNCINSIVSFLRQNRNEEAVSYLMKFSKVMRVGLEHSFRDVVTIEEEIRSLKDYLELEQVRVKDKFNYEIIVSSNVDIEKCELPCMVIQPFVENAIFHGVIPKNGFGKISVSFEYFDDLVVVFVEDDGVGRGKSRKPNKDRRKSFGLRLIQEKFDVLNFRQKNKMEFKIYDLNPSNNGGYGTRVEIRIPQ